MSRTYRNSKQGDNQQRRIHARAVRRNPPDLRILAKALLMQAADEAAAAADKKPPAKPTDLADESPDTKGLRP